MIRKWLIWRHLVIKLGKQYSDFRRWQKKNRFHPTCSPRRPFGLHPQHPSLPGKTRKRRRMSPLDGIRGSLSVCQTAIKQKQKVKTNLTSKSKLFTMEKYKFLSRDLLRTSLNLRSIQFLLIIIPRYLFDFIRNISFRI